MREYHKINTIFKRDEAGNIWEGHYSTPEIEYLRDNIWEFQEKIDGTNIRVMWDGEDGDNIRFGGKTNNAQIPSFLISKLQDLFPVKNLQGVFPIVAHYPKVCLYGEGFGARIQKGGGNYIPDGVDFILFDVWIDGWWLKRKDVEDVAQQLGIRYVPVIGYGSIKYAVDLVKNGLTSIFGSFLAEGIVLRPEVSLFARNGDRVIAKIKHRDFK